LVIAGLVEMVMRIEERSDLRIRREGLQRGKQLVAAVWRAAVDEDEAVGGRESHDIGSAAVEDRELVGGLSTQQRGKDPSHSSCQRVFQYFSTIQSRPSFLGVGPTG